jgi:hypothetical protein
VRLFKIAFIYSFTFTLLLGCSISKEEVKQSAIESIKIAFQEDSVKANETNDQFSFYLPDTFDIESASGSNLILSEGKQQYILFVNKNEKRNSKLLYQKGIDTATDILVNETMETDDEFKYTIINKLNEKVYEVITGIGGIKMTTHANSQDVDDSVRKMIKIVQSVQY